VRLALILSLVLASGCFNLDRLEALSTTSQLDGGDPPRIDLATSTDADLGIMEDLQPSDGPLAGKDLAGVTSDLPFGPVDLETPPRDLGAVAPTTDRLVFITSALVNRVELGSLSDADSRCQTAAQALPLPGTYKAWLSAPDLAAKDRLTHATGRYHLVTGETVASSWSDLVDGTIAHAIDVNELGQVQPFNVLDQPNRYRSILTATTLDGSYVGPDDWRLGGYFFLGSANQVDEDWTHIIENMSAASSWSYALYCLQQ